MRSLQGHGSGERVVQSRCREQALADGIELVTRGREDSAADFVTQCSEAPGELAPQSGSLRVTRRSAVERAHHRRRIALALHAELADLGIQLGQLLGGQLHIE